MPAVGLAGVVIGAVQQLGRRYLCGVCAAAPGISAGQSVSRFFWWRLRGGAAIYVDFTNFGLRSLVFDCMSYRAPHNFHSSREFTLMRLLSMGVILGNTKLILGVGLKKSQNGFGFAVCDLLLCYFLN